MTAVIIDDEKNARETTRFLLLKYFPELTICGEADTIEEGIRCIEEKRPEVVFLDIEMPEGSGFEIASRTRHIPYALVFVTAFDQYAIKAFKANAIDYLLKPLEPNELIRVVQKIYAKEISLMNKTLLNKLNFLQTDEDRISIPTSEGYTLLKTSEIIRVKGESNYAGIYLSDKTNLLVSKTLKDLSELLREPRFLRVHSSHLVNTDFIVKYLKADGGSLLLKDGTIVPVSKSKKEEVLRIFGKSL